MSKFLSHELENNRFIQYLQNELSLKDVFFKRSELIAIFVPIDVSIQKLKFNLPIGFVETHLGQFQESDGEYMTLKGMHVMEVRNQLITDTQKVKILRKGSITLYTTTHPVFLISCPLFYEGCEWEFLKKEVSDYVPRNKSPKPEEIGVEMKESTMKKSIFSLLNLIPSSKENLFSRKVNRSPMTPASSNSNGNEPGYVTVSSEPEKEKDAKKEKPESPKVLKYEEFLKKLQHRNSSKIKKRMKIFLERTGKSGYDPEIPNKVLWFIRSTIHQFILTDPFWASFETVDKKQENGKVSKKNKVGSLDEDELDSIKEHMEKYTMTQLYSRLFSPTMECIMKDNQISNNLQSLQGLQPEHSNISRKLLRNASEQFERAKNELKRMNHFHSPRDKLICVSNASKILFTILHEAKKPGSPPPGHDDFLPLFLYLVLRANPPHLASNIKYIEDFRDPEKLEGEAGWNLTIMQSAVEYWSNVNHKSLFDITEKEFLDINKQGMKEKGLIPSSPQVHANKTEEPSFKKKKKEGINEKIRVRVNGLNLVNAEYFMNANHSDIKVGDVKHLLEEYKSLMTLVLIVKEILEDE